MPYRRLVITAILTLALLWTDGSSIEEGFKIYRNGAVVGQVGANVLTLTARARD